MQTKDVLGTSMSDLPEHVRRNRAAWDLWASEYEDAGEAAWANQTPTWGIWSVPETDLRMLPEDLAGKDAIELGCGTAYVSAWLARRDMPSDPWSPPMTPEERNKKIESYGAAYQRLVTALDRFPREMWQFRPSPDRWTIHEIIVHIADSEANSYIRCRRFLAEPGSTVLGYDENKWAQALRYHDQSTDEALELFKWLRFTSYSLVKDSSESTWSNTVNHSENGEMTMDDWLDTYDRHIPDHISQMQTIHDDWMAQKALDANPRHPNRHGGNSTQPATGKRARVHTAHPGLTK